MLNFSMDISGSKHPKNNLGLEEEVRPVLFGMIRPKTQVHDLSDAMSTV